MKHGRTALFVVAITLSVTPCAPRAQASPTASSSTQFTEPRAIDRLRSRFAQTRSWFRLVANARYGRDEAGRLVPDYSSLDHPRVRRRDGAGHTIVPHFPAWADGPMQIASGENATMWVESTADGARPVPVAVQDGVIVYPDAFVDTDVFYKSTPTHTDEYLLLRSPRAPSEWRYTMRRGPGIEALRRAGPAIEAVDANGSPWFRASPPVAIDGHGHRVVGTLELDGDAVVVRIDLRGLQMPVLVDPDWTPTADMSFGRFYAGANLLPDGRVLSTGGCSASVCSGDLTIGSCRHIVETAEALDVNTRTWSPVGAQTVPRFFHVAETLRDGRVLLAGGCTNADCSTATVDAEIFDPADNRFHPTGGLAEARGGISSTRLSDGRIFVTGGCSSTGCSGRTEIFDPSRGSFTVAAPLGIPRGRAATVLLDDGRVLVAGGCTTINCASVSDKAEVYDPATDRWTPAMTMTTPRAGHYAVVLADHTVLVGGGCTDASCTTFLGSTERFDPSALAFTAGADQLRPRLGAIAVLLPDGRAMITQGCAGRADCDLTVEIFDPGTGLFAFSEPAVTQRAFHQVIVHPIARELIAVGGCQPSTCSWWNETYDISGIVPPADAGSELDAAIDVALDTAVDMPPARDVVDVRLGFDVTPMRDAGADSARDEAIGSRPSGCACSVPQSSPSRAGRFAMLALVAVFAIRRRRQRKSIAVLAALALSACGPPSSLSDGANDADRDGDVALDSLDSLDAVAFDDAVDDVEALDAPLSFDVADATTDATEIACSPACRPCERCTAGACVSIGGQASVAAVASGWNHTLAVDIEGALWTWGDNSGGQLGLGDTTQRRVATRVDAPGAAWIRVAAGSRHSCAIRSDGSLWCWGINAEGQLGVGDTSNRSTPTRVGSDSDWLEVICGGLHSCGLRTDGALYCWGSNVAGQLGLGDALTNQTVPQRVGTEVGWRGLAAKARFTCGLRPDDSLWCWGDNSNSQLGVGDTVDRHVPTRLAIDGPWSAVRMGPLHACGVANRGELYCWGANSSGQLGMGDSMQRATPEHVGVATDWTQLTAGFTHTCGVRNGTDTFCWGDGMSGKLGTGDVTSRPSPSRVAGGATYTIIVAGMNHTCGLQAGGGLFCWGDNTFGQLGEGDAWAVLVPAPVCFEGLASR